MTRSADDLNRRALLRAGAALAAGAAAAPAAAADPAPSAPDLTGKSVLITGSSSGFGRLSALHLARSGATVIASMRNLKGGKRPEAQELLDTASDEKLRLTVVDIDVTDDALVASGVAAAEETAGGGLDAVLSNAGIAIAGPVELHDHAQTYKQFDVNLFGSLRMARAAAPGMRAKGEGVIMPVSSQLGRFLFPNIGVYSSTKFALEAAFEAMAYEFAPSGVEVTIIQPGGYPTKIWENGSRYTAEMLDAADAERKEAYAAHVAMTNGMMSGDPWTTDPMDIPRAVADIMARPAGQRPLRVAVAPDTRGVDAINAVSAEVQKNVLSEGPYEKWRSAVAD
ncbi:MAG: SDR family NAD(P)-dependent oxidoreductase [Pseudomonadota bacterium]